MALAIRFYTHSQQSGQSAALWTGVKAAKVFHRATFLELPRFNHLYRFLPALPRMQVSSVSSMSFVERLMRSGQSGPRHIHLDLPYLLGFALIAIATGIGLRDP